MKLVGFGKSIRLNIGRDTRLFIGRRVFFDDFCSIELHNESCLEIKKGVQFNRFCVISARKKIQIGEDTIFGPNCKIYDHNHRFDLVSPVEKSKFTCSPVAIGKGCWFGSNVVICAGAKIGDYCVIGANAVVRGTVSSGTLVK